jgi:hypothetical protein
MASTDHRPTPAGRSARGRKTAPAFDRDAAVHQYLRNRARTRALLDFLEEEAYTARPIPLRHPFVFYDGHLPAFSFNTLVKRALGEQGIDAGLEELFARGIDPHESAAGAHEAGAWPDRAVVRQFADEADRRVLLALEHADLERPGDPLLERAEAVHAILEHEAMHRRPCATCCTGCRCTRSAGRRATRR